MSRIIVAADPRPFGMATSTTLRRSTSCAGPATTGWVSIESYFGDVLDLQARSLTYLKQLVATEWWQSPKRKDQPRELHRLLFESRRNGGGARDHPRGIAVWLATAAGEGRTMQRQLAECDFILIPDQPIRRNTWQPHPG